MFVLFIFQCVFLANIVAATNARGSICPPTVLIFPCTCVHSAIECSGFDNPEDLEDIFRDIMNLEFPILRILNSRMDYLPHLIFELARFREIYVANSNFSSLFNNTPSSEFLERFVIDSCYFGQRIKGEMFSNLSLSSLDFINNGLTSIRRTLTDGLPPTLSKLSIRETKLHNLSVNALYGLDNLQELYVQHGDLRRLNKIKFPMSIRIINLRHNKIEYLPDGIFDGLPNLSDVVLEKNLLVTVAKEVFASVPKLFLSKNPIRCDCKLKWLVEPENKTYVVNGKCASPFNMIGKDINQLISHDFTSCFWRE